MEDGGKKMKVTEKIDKYLKEDYDYVNFYKTLNDAEVQDEGLAKGQTEIWYMHPDSFRKLSMGPKFLEKQGEMPTVRDIIDTHILLGHIKETNLDKIYKIMQGEFWSPRGEARSLLRKMGLQHTSMSVGDIIKSKGKYYMVDNSGFYPLKKEE